MAQKTKMEAVEEYVQNQKTAQLRAMLEMYAVSVKVWSPLKDVNSKVYGEDSGAIDENVFDTVLAIVTSHDFFPTGPSSSGAFTEGWLYTFSDKIDVGCTVELHSGDQRQRRYKVDVKFALGQTRNVFSRFRIVALGAEATP